MIKVLNSFLILIFNCCGVPTTKYNKTVVSFGIFNLQMKYMTYLFFGNFYLKIVMYGTPSFTQIYLYIYILSKYYVIKKYSKLKHLVI